MPQPQVQLLLQPQVQLLLQPQLQLLLQPQVQQPQLQQLEQHLFANLSSAASATAFPSTFTKGPLPRKSWLNKSDVVDISVSIEPKSVTFKL